MHVIEIGQIRDAVASIDLVPIIEEGFVAYSEGRAVVPPVGELLFHDPPGDVHIKYGYLQGDAYYVIKIASGFYENAKLNLPSGNGLMLLFSQQTGELLSVLLDEGYLTDLRTAAAGAIAAKYLAPRTVGRIGIVGTGVQARLQLRLLEEITPCRDVIVWGRDLAKLERYKQEMEPEGYSIAATMDTCDVTSTSNLIVTATASTTPLVSAGQIQAGTHITAVGADTPEKQELDPTVLAKADVVVADSISQCVERGDIAHAIRIGSIKKNSLLELGDIISGNARGRTSEDQITVADLTGVAVQDIQIAKAVYHAAQN